MAEPNIESSPSHEPSDSTSASNSTPLPTTTHNAHLNRQPSNHLMSVLSHTTSLRRNGSSRMSRISRSHSAHSGVRSESTMSEDPEVPRPPRPESPKPPEDNAPPPAEEVTRLRLSAHYAGLVLASMLGCLIRLGLNALGTYDGKVIYALAWSQGVGSGIMGLSLARKNEIVSIYPPIYTFLTTGIAGSVTTFSSWMLEGYLAFSNFDKHNRKGLHDTVDGVAYSFSTFAIAIASLRFGEHFSTFLPSLTFLRKLSHPPQPDRLPVSSSSTTNVSGNAGAIANGESSSASSEQTQIQTQFQAVNQGNANGNTDPEKWNHPSNGNGHGSNNRYGGQFIRKRLHSQTPLLDCLWISTAFFAYWIILLLYFLGPRGWRHDVVFPMLLSPPGAMIRFYLAKLNTRPPFIDRFPLGTFIANILATIIISITYSQQRKSPAIKNASTCNGLYAIQQGFCGCLSTVSTFVVEARTVKGWSKWTYLGSSIIAGHVVALAIVGGTGWGSGGYQGVCHG